MKHMVWFPVAFAFVWLAACAAPPAAPPTPVPLEKVVIGFDAMSITGGPMHFAQDLGLFKKYGLDEQLIYVDAGTKLTQAMVAGQIDIGQNGYSPVISAAAAGAKLVFIGGISNTMPFQLIVKPEIKTPADLKGKKVAISKYGSSTDTALQIVLKYYALDLNSVTRLQIGSEPERVAAMQSGQVDGILVQYPTTGTMIQQGYRMLQDVAEIGGQYPNTSFVVSRDYLAKKRDVVKRFLMAMTEGINRYRTETDAAMTSTAKFLKIEDAKGLYETHAYYTSRVFPSVPRATLDGVANLIKLDPEVNGKLKAEDVVDNSIFDELDKEGFLKKVGAQ